ncbi:MAG: acetyltransferase [Clostridiales bacterium]|nr:acetyltransferase [Clostridiales bacterium]
MSKPIIILGAGGHARVVADILCLKKEPLLGFLDDNKKGQTVAGYPVLGTIAEVERFSNEAQFVIGIGNNIQRCEIAQKYVLPWYTVVHPTALIASDAVIGEGTVVMANVVVNASARVGCHSILNTAADVEHDDLIGNYVHLSPHAVLGGTVSVGDRTHIGIGAVIRNNIQIAADCMVGAGAVVVHDILYRGTYVGVPAKRVIY